LRRGTKELATLPKIDTKSNAELEQYDWQKEREKER
jgi:hypothetical protein